MITVRLAALVVTVCLSGSVVVAQAPPTLSRQQRDLLQNILNAVDAASAQPPLADAQWQTHVMRASDGSHYVAFTIEPPPATPLPPGPALLYVRLATSNPLSAQKITERSAIRDWLAGSRTDPRLLPRRGIAVGDMPIMGATGLMGSTRQPVSSGTNDLRLMALEREREKKEQEDRDKQRRAELEGKQTATREMFPFEDFDLASNSTRPGGARIVTRAFTTGPGEYDLFVAWGDPTNAKPASTVRVVRTTLHLPPASTTGLTTGSIILADKVGVRATAYPTSEQAAHPYSIGPMEIVPAADTIYTKDDALAVAFQVINAKGSDLGMPDVAVGFRIVRVSGGRESPVASLNPQFYNGTTLPADFDLRQGHPVFVAVSAPLATLSRGDYRLKIGVNDRVAGTSTTADADFHVVGTPASLLAEAPPLARPFSKDAVLEPTTVQALVDEFTPTSPSPPLARALTVARSGKLVDLLIEEPVPQAERGVRTALTGMALLSVGDTSAAIQFQRALTEGAPAVPTQFLIGAARAAQNRDTDAIAAWQAALAAGDAPASARTLLVEALLRRGDHTRALAVIKEAGNASASSALVRLTAVTHLAASRPTEAIAILDAHLAAHPEDSEARWLLIHALYADVVKGGNRDRFASEARRYVDDKGAHSDLVSEWLRISATF